MPTCALLLVSLWISPVQEFSLRTGDATVCAADDVCFERPARLKDGLNVRASLKIFDDIYDIYDDDFRIKDDRERFAFSLEEQQRKIRAKAAGGGVTTAQRRHLLATYAEIRVDQIGFDRARARPLLRDDGTAIFEIPFVARVTVTPHGAAARSTSLRGRLEIPPDTKEKIIAETLVDQFAISARLARLIELDARSSTAVDEADLRDEILPAALSQIIAAYTF